MEICEMVSGLAPIVSPPRIGRTQRVAGTRWCVGSHHRSRPRERMLLSARPFAEGQGVVSAFTTAVPKPRSLLVGTRV